MGSKLFLVFTGFILLTCCMPSEDHTLADDPCKEIPFADVPYASDHSTTTAPPDIVYINLDSLNYLDSLNALQYTKLTNEQLISFIKSHSLRQNISNLTNLQDFDHSYNNEIQDKLKATAIPLAIKERLFPIPYFHKHKYYIPKGTNNPESYNPGSKTKYYGYKLTYSCRFFSFYAINERPEHIQLFVTGEGKYEPSIHMITLSKKDLKFISCIKVYDAFSDAGSTDNTFGMLDSNFHSLRILREENRLNPRVEFETDTVYFYYHINDKGEIFDLSPVRDYSHY